MPNNSNKRQHLIYRPVSLGQAPVKIVKGEGGSLYLSSKEPLDAYPERITDRLVSGAKAHPERTLMAKRDKQRQWQYISYADMLDRARRIGQALIDRGLSADRPVMILSGNDLEHIQLALAALYAGIPYCPVSPASSLLSKDHNKLKHITSLITPGLVMVSDGQAYSRAINAALAADVEIVTVEGAVKARESTSFEALLQTRLKNIDAVNKAIQPEDIAKLLFTSGSTKLPKAVTTTHRMLCANQQMLLQTFPCFGEKPPVILDWLPWNHTFGGSHNVGIALYNGGSYYINDGKPVEVAFDETIRNLKEISPTVYFDVPKGWELLTEALEQDEKLRQNFYRQVELFFFAGAGLSQAVWDRLDAVSEQHRGERIRVMSGLGMTETAPSCLFSTGPVVQAGYIGLPAPGCETKLVPFDEKYEIRFKGPNVMPGYWRQPALDKDVFDEEGFYCTGDAVVFHNERRPEDGLMFTGRLVEDFKLSSGTFVSVGPLRTQLIAEGAPYVQDAVITGINRNAIGVLIFPRLEHCRTLSTLTASATIDDVLSSASVAEFFDQLLARVNSNATGSSSRLAFLHLLREPPVIDKHELTDKGTINQRAVQINRAALIDDLYASVASHPIAKKAKAAHF